MPHLDAGTLTEDPKGLAFLAEVIEVAADHAPPCWTASEADAAQAEEGPVHAPSPARRTRPAMVHAA